MSEQFIELAIGRQEYKNLLEKEGQHGPFCHLRAKIRTVLAVYEGVSANELSGCGNGFSFDKAQEAYILTQGYFDQNNTRDMVHIKIPLDPDEKLKILEVPESE